MTSSSQMPLRNGALLLRPQPGTPPYHLELTENCRDEAVVGSSGYGMTLATVHPQVRCSSCGVAHAFGEPKWRRRGQRPDIRQ